MSEEVSRGDSSAPRRHSRGGAGAGDGYVRAVAWAACALAVALLGVSWRYSGGLWRDEVNSVNFANLPTLGLLWRHLDGESFPLLWILIERAWSSVLGTSDAVIRGMGLATALCLVGALWLCGRWCGYLPVVALGLIASNPVLLRTASLNRAYGFGFLLVVLTYHAVWKLAQGPTLRRTVIAAVLALAATQTLYYNIVFVTAMLLGALGVGWYRGDRGFWRPLAGIGGLCALSLVPYVFGPIRAERSWSFLIAYKMNRWQIFGLIHQTLNLEQLRHSPPLVALGSTLLLLAWLSLGALCLSALAAYRPGDGPRARWSDGGDVARFACVTALVSLIGYTLVLDMVGYYIETFHLSILVLLLAVAGGHLAVTARLAWVGRVAVPTLVLLTLAVNLPRVARALEVRQTDADLAAAVVSAQARPGDLILVTPYWLGQPFARYYHGPVPWATAPSLSQYSYGGEIYVWRHMLRPTPDMDHLAEIRATLQAGHTVWAVGQLATTVGLTGPPPLPPPFPARDRPHMAPFLNGLAEREAYALAHHAQAAVPVAVPTPQAVNPKEDLQIVRFSGWKG